MAKKRDPRIELFLNQPGVAAARVILVCGRRRLHLRDSEGNDFWPNEYVARRVAKWWAKRLGLPVVEVEG